MLKLIKNNEIKRRYVRIKRKIVGITGLIASGKSTLSSYLSSKGYKIVDADAISRDITKKDKIGYSKVVEKFGEEIILLRHIILAHHGKYEFGSPKLPMIKEAEIINFIDNIDARMMMFEKNLTNVEPGTFSDKLFGLEGRHFYVPTFDKEE